jgi:hypothetical protein
MERMTRAKVEALIGRLNAATNSPAEPYTKNPDGTYTANPGNFHLEGAYGGHKLARMATPTGGSSDPLNTGFVSWRVLYDAIDNYMRAIDDVSRGHVIVKVRKGDGQ